MIRRALAYLPAALWAAVLFLLGAQTDPPAPDLAVRVDTAAHLALYGILGGLAGRGWRLAGRWPARGWLLALTLLVGVVDEWNQASVPGRSAEIVDLAADVVGVIAGFVVVSRWGERVSEEPRDEP